MPAIANVFSWSKSRDEQFRDCRRKYYYDKYASWGGWDKNAPSQARLAYVLKNLKNRWAWKGETVHHVIEHVMKALKNGSPIPLAQALERLTQTMRENYRASKAKKYYEDPKNRPGLFEHEYEKPVSDDVWKKIHDSSAECLRNFYASSLFVDLEKDDKKNWLVIEDLEEFDFEGSRIYVKLDFARRKNGLIEIYDWKTGKEESADAGLQMAAYAMYAMKKWSVPLSALRGYLLFLSSSTPTPKEEPLSESLLNEARGMMGESIRGMHALLADPLKNIPKPIQDFAYTSNASLCERCNFLKICDRP